MSSDESDYDELEDNPVARMRAPRYYIRKPRWRHKEVSKWLQVFDIVYSILRRTTMSRRGAYAHPRADNALEDAYSQNLSFVGGLPVSAYDEDWLKSRIDADFAVQPSKEQWEFSHNAEVYR